MSSMIIDKIIEYIIKDIPHYPVILYYNFFNRIIFNKISLIESELSDLDYPLIRVSKLSLNESQNSFYDDLKEILYSVDFNLIKKKKKIILVDSYLPLGFEFNIDSNREIFNLIMDFCNDKQPVNINNTILILGMTESQKRGLQSASISLRKYYANGKYDLEEIDHSFNNNVIDSILNLTNSLLPSENPSSIVDVSPINYLIHKQMSHMEGFSIYNGSLVNLAKNFSGVLFSDLSTRLPVVNDDPPNLVDIFNETSQGERRLFENAQKFNILQSILYLKQLDIKIQE